MSKSRPMVDEAQRLLRTGRTVYLSQKPYLAQPRLTTAIPCGQTRAFSLGRVVDGVLPTPAELREDLSSGLAQLGRVLARAA